ncbi:unnamed protein product [marine sediment metagenome]|uniref:Yip1 domain-containing protein n=1 Tax=marine sediment metagenome TaxID=412755 RepID=X0T4P3_9ZZZZ
MASSSDISVPVRKSIRTWLFNPFHYVAGGMALAVGLAFILAAGLIGSLSNSHFDGVLDFHTGTAAPLWIFLSEGLVDWIVLACLLLVGGKIISGSRVRVLDVFGTQALARFPTAVTAVFALLPGYRRYGLHLAARYVKTLPDVQTHAADPVMFALTILVTILMVIWMVVLMYRAYSVSCNVRGGKAVGVFIAALIVGEAISKVLVVALAHVARVNFS